MTDHNGVYIERHPGELITAEDWNDLQRQIAEDIRTTASEAAEGVDHVASADDANHLDGKDLAALTDEIAKRVLEAVQTESGYRKVFRVLEPDEYDIIEHGLGNFPLVDVYELAYFEVACREDDATFRSITTFYLHHSSERRVRVTEDDGTSGFVDIEIDDLPQVGIPFADALAHYDVQYTDSSSLEDVEVEFWKAFFGEPNDPFDDNQYCHSPWFERCCRDHRTVGEIKSRGDWDDMWLQFRALKIVGGPARMTDVPVGSDIEPEVVFDHPTPANVAVFHVDLNQVALRLVGAPMHTTVFLEDDEDGRPVRIPEEFRSELKVMVLLRV